MLLLKHFITKVLEYKAEELNLYALLHMCSLVMSLCSRDLHVTSLIIIITLNSSRLTVVQLTQRLVFGWCNINLFLWDLHNI